MPKRFIYPVEGYRLPHNVGEKAKNLQRLYKKGFSIPQTYAILWALQRAYYRNGEQIPDYFRRDLERVIDLNKTYAVRSSANVEDAQSQSYAGQFLSVLDVSGVDKTLDAIRRVWDSSHLEAPRTYQIQQNSEQDKIEMGVVLQEMIPAMFSGVAFSRNPITNMDEVVIEAILGSGVALVQDGITPQRWIWKWGKWLQRPDMSDIPQNLIQEIALEVRRISSSFGFPVDLEWAFDGQRVIWLQMREITALQSIDIYANHLPKEFMPGVIKPLVWSVNVPMVNGVWVQLLTELIGKNQLDPFRLARSFYGYAYFNMGLLGSVFKKIGLPDNSLDRLMGFESEGDNGPSFRPSLTALRHIPRLIKFTLEKIWFDKKLESFFVYAHRKYEQLYAKNLGDLNDIELMNYIEQLNSLNKQTTYFNIVTPLLMLVYHQLAKRNLARLSIDYERINWLEGWEERIDYDPIPHLQTLGALYYELDLTERQAVSTSNYSKTSSRLESFRRQLDAFIGQFGHLSDSGNDFSSPLWRETPDIVLNLIIGYANNPSLGKHNQPTNLEERLDLDAPLLKRAIRYSQYREKISFLYTRGISMFRITYQRIGESFCNLGWLENPSDVFFLENKEIVSAVHNVEEANSLKDLVQKRRNNYTSYESISLPPVIYGDQSPPILDKRTATLSGIPTSRGLHRGVVRVVKGISDFPKVVDDCVLVIPYSDVSWTPLFSRAGSLVAEAGGMLSHSSIVAREYGIPAIVSVPDATQLEDGIEVTVDGYSGNIILHDSNFLEEM